MKMLDKPIIRSVGITPCASGWDVTPAEPCPSPKRIVIMNSLPVGLFSITIL